MLEVIFTKAMALLMEPIHVQLNKNVKFEGNKHPLIGGLRGKRVPDEQKMCISDV